MQATAIPTVSIVIPARNTSGNIGEQLAALASQNFDGIWEVIVVNDGSTDDTIAVAQLWRDKLPSLRVLSTGGRGRAHARNVGTLAAHGRLIAYCDSDDVVSGRWLSGLTSALKDHAIATGPMEATMLNSHVKTERLYEWYWPDGDERVPNWRGYLAPVNGGNMGVRRDMFDAIGGFDVTFPNGHDYDFAFRVQLAGGTVGFSSDALVHVRLRKGWAFLRRQFQQGKGHVALYRRFRERGMSRELRQGIVWLAASVVRSPTVLVPRCRYLWIAAAGGAAGRLVGSVRQRVLFL
jgi:glycosyltransferase involved in cell wall biosynthesis